MITHDPAPKHVDLYGNVFEVPDFTMKELRAAIPPHCFRPSTARGAAYVVRDFALLGTLAWVTWKYTPYLPSSLLRAVVYTLYTVAAGMIMTGIWILAHECGHRAFSPSRKVNDVMGYFLHTFLLVPYFSWRISHAHHHRATGDIQRDTVYVPHSREFLIKSSYGEETNPLTVGELTEDAPIVTVWHCLLFMLFGWPLYMLDNLSGQKGASGFPRFSHYWFGSDSGLYKQSELPLVLASDVGVLVMSALLYLAVKLTDLWTVTVLYAIPYLMLNHWVVTITYLQHTDGRLPHFTHSQWTFSRGASATIDRSFKIGPLDIDRHLFHGILGTHVIHHLVSTIPFYHAYEATEAIQAVMGKHYQEDRATPLLTALFRNMRDCQFVEESGGMDGSGVLMYRNLHGRGMKPRDVNAGERMTEWEGHLPAVNESKKTSGLEWRGWVSWVW